MFFPYFYLLMFYQCGTVFQTAFLTAYILYINNNNEEICIYKKK